MQISKIQKAADTSAHLVVIVLCGYLLLLQMSLGRPLWIDEFLQFAVAAAPSSTDAWSLIRRSIQGGVNHNQTGVYMMLDYWLEHVVGANAFLLRLPSLVCGVLFLSCVARLFSLLSFSIYWTLLALVAVLGQQSAMEWLGEARPYFPLAAATIGTLVYYLVQSSDRRGIDRFFGWVSVFIGVAFHPYFPAYWITILALTYVHNELERPDGRGVISLARHADPLLLASGTVFYAGLAGYTWFGHSRNLNLDVFQYVREPSLWTNFSDYMHFEFLSPHLIFVSLVTVLAIIGAFWLPDRRRVALFRLLTPCLLILAMLAVSILLSAASYLSHYWIIRRQWVASAAILPLAFVWLWAELARIYSRFRPAMGIVAWLASAAAVIGPAAIVNAELFDGLTTYVKQTRKAQKDCNSPPAAPSDADAWVALANQNIDCGGPVWPVFLEYYGVPAPKNRDIKQ